MTWFSARYLGGPAHDTTYDGPYDEERVVREKGPLLDALGDAPRAAEIEARLRIRHMYRLQEFCTTDRFGLQSSTFTYRYQGPWTASAIAAFLYTRAIDSKIPGPIIRELSRELLELRASRQWTEYPGGSGAERYLAKVRASEELAVGLVQPEDVSKYASTRSGENWLRRAAAHLGDHPDYREEWRP